MQSQTIIDLVINEIKSDVQNRPEWPKNLVAVACIICDCSMDLVTAAMDYENGGRKKECLDQIRTNAIKTAAASMRLLVNIKD